MRALEIVAAKLSRNRDVQATVTGVALGGGGAILGGGLTGLGFTGAGTAVTAHAVGAAAAIPCVGATAASVVTGIATVASVAVPVAAVGLAVYGAFKGIAKLSDVVNKPQRKKPSSLAMSAN